MGLALQASVAVVLLCAKRGPVVTLLGTGMDEDDSGELGTEVLRDVSRSFYLTLRALPKSMRPSTSVGYLLARASDTIADSGGGPLRRESLLERFQMALRTGPDENFFRDAAGLASEEGLKDGERILMRRLDAVFRWLSELQSWEQKAVRKVVTTILEGQRWDLERFSGGGVVALDSGEELLRYCYLVAGCVGEFWTEVGFQSEPDFARRPFEEMLGLGKDYGSGLQLVNILRDVGEDEERGRSYLPGDRQKWLSQADEFLANGILYAKAVRGRRARFATVLPALIGQETLLLLRSSSDEELQAGVKVTRKVVKRCLRRAFFFR